MPTLNCHTTQYMTWGISELTAYFKISQITITRRPEIISQLGLHIARQKLYCAQCTLLYSVYCTVLSVLYRTQCTVLFSVYCTVLSVLYCTQCTVLFSVYYCTVLSALYCTQCPVLYSVCCTTLSVLYCTQCTVLYSVYCTVFSSKHFVLFAGKRFSPPNMAISLLKSELAVLVIGFKKNS